MGSVFAMQVIFWSMSTLFRSIFGLRVRSAGDVCVRVRSSVKFGVSLRDTSEFFLGRLRYSGQFFGGLSALCT